ncbi:MAG: ribonuclease H family protein, partial [Desulfobulbaceae bacterium]|nr:ribonuclease H family protein [Desulfobulbaceae bacterium]
MAAKKFYAIAVGRKPGIYDNWAAAQAQVMSFAGAVYKGFATRAEAEAWIKRPSYGPGTPNSGQRRAAGAKGAATPPPHPAGPDHGGVAIYTDGGARYNPGPGGYGVVQIYNGQRKELSGGFRHTTNNRMELMGCIVALRELEHRDQPITLHTDSSYVVNGIAKGWAKGWRKRGWIKSDKNPAINPDLWGELLDLV